MGAVDRPEGDFTVADNQSDLVDLERWHPENLAFTYTIIHLYDARPERIPVPRLRVHRSPDGTLLSRREIIPTAGGAGEWSDIDAAVYHWVREREMDAGIDETVLTELEEWIRQEWGLDRIVFVTNEQFGTQTDLFQRFGFGREFKIRRPDAEGTYFGCGPQASKAKPMSIQPRSGLAPQSPDPR